MREKSDGLLQGGEESVLTFDAARDSLHMRLLIEEYLPVLTEEGRGSALCALTKQKFDVSINICNNTHQFTGDILHGITSS